MLYPRFYPMNSAKVVLHMTRFGKLVNTLAVLALTNICLLGSWLQISPLAYTLLCALLVAVFMALNIAPLWKKGNFTRLGVLLGGEVLLKIGMFCFTFDLILTFLCGVHWIPNPLPVGVFLLHILLWVLLSAVLMFNGGVRMVVTSLQLGIKWRVLILLFWWVPVVNLFLLGKACRLVREEYAVETEKAELNCARMQNETCKTNYPLVLVHGVFFRDRKCFNYWGRIPGELIRNGATIFYGEQQSAAGTEAAAAELKERILQIVKQTGCGKVNIIAHSKGGLESRCAISRMGLAPYVASLTTINTPHRGCAFVDWLLQHTPKGFCSWLAKRYNGALRRLGDPNPDFYAAVRDLTSQRCAEFNRVTPDAPGVFYQSVGSKMKGWTSAPFPQNLSYLLVRRFDKQNDGLVGVDSMRWGNSFQMLTAKGRRGISHGDLIDLNRQNIRGFDVREFYVQLVRSLRSQGF